MMIFSPPKFALVFVIFAWAISCEASSGDRQQEYQSCLNACSRSGCVGDHCIPGCSFGSPRSSSASNDGQGVDGGSAPRLVANPLELRFFQWDCLSECKYECMIEREEQKVVQGLAPEKYDGKWPFIRFLGMQEPASALFSSLNLLQTLLGLTKFIRLVYFELPRKPMGDKGPMYEYAGLWIVYGGMAINSWFWSTIFHARDTKYTEAWDYSSAIALVGGMLILAIFRVASLRLEAARVMVSAPIIGFTATHILYLNFYHFDYGLNMKVCMAMGVGQLLLWLLWANLSRHPARAKLSIAVVGTAMAMLLEVFDFPPLYTLVDAHALWHAVTIPLIYLWWSFVCDDAKLRTAMMVDREKMRGGKEE